MHKLHPGRQSRETKTIEELEYPSFFYFHLFPAIRNLIKVFSSILYSVNPGMITILSLCNYFYPVITEIPRQDSPDEDKSRQTRFCPEKEMFFAMNNIARFQKVSYPFQRDAVRYRPEIRI